MGDLKKMLQEATNFAHSAETNLFSGKNKEAIEMIKKAEELGKEIFQSIPTDPGIKSLFQKIEKLKKDLERKGIVLKEGIGETLPFEVQSHINRIRTLLISVPQQPYLLDQAKSELNSLITKFAGSETSIPEIKEIQLQIYKLEEELEDKISSEHNEKIQKGNKALEEEQFSNSWFEKLNSIPYFDGDSTYLPSLLEQKMSYFKAFELIKELNSLNFRGKKSEALENLEKDIILRIKNFQEKFNKSVKTLVGQYKQEIKDKINFLLSNNKPENDQKTTLNYFEKEEINELRLKLEELKKLFEPPSLPEELIKLFTDLIDLNESRKALKKSKINV